MVLQAGGNHGRSDCRCTTPEVRHGAVRWGRAWPVDCRGNERKHRVVYISRQWISGQNILDDGRPGVASRR